jgi:membrane-bound lytic murein transglycosylase D
MNRSWPIHLLFAALCCFLAAAATPPVAHAAETSVASTADSSYSPDISVTPKAMQDLINASQAKFLEGSNLIKAGDSDRARESFNKAVDLLLQSDWDITSTPAMNRFFQNLIQQIQESESRYLAAPYNTEEEIEAAIVDELADVDSIPAAIDPTIQDTLIAELSKTKYEIPITINEMVAKSLDYWLNTGRKHFVDGLLRSGQYRPIIEKVFREESIPLDLLYLAQVESLFKTHAVSRAQAKGIWQFGRGTAIRYGLKVTRDVDERSDPEKSTRAAARYLNDLFTMFKDWNLVLAAYNWGEGKVQRLINSTGVNDFWQLVDLRRRLPAETKNHVPLIQASVILGRNPEKFGLPTELDPPLKYAEVSVSKPIDLRAAAKVLSTSIDELKKLNPSLRGITTPANYPNFQLKVPADSDPNIHEQLDELPIAKVKLPDEFIRRHKVRQGDTLTRIAARYHVSVAAIERANNISSKKKLTAGSWIQVPSHPTVASKASSSKPASTRTALLKASSGKSKAANTTLAKSQRTKKASPAASVAKLRPSKIKHASPKDPL